MIATGHHPFPGRQTLRGKVVHGVVEDRAVGNPFRAVPAKGLEAQPAAGVPGRVEMAGEGQELPVAFPQTAGDPSVARDPGRTGQIGGLGPVQTIPARGKGIAGVRAIVAGHDVPVLLRCDVGPRQSGTVAPHGPEASVMMGQVGVLMNPRAGMLPDVADDHVPGGDPWQFLVVDLVRILRQPVAGKHQGIVGWRLVGTGGVESGLRREQKSGHRGEQAFHRLIPWVAAVRKRPPGAFAFATNTGRPDTRLPGVADGHPGTGKWLVPFEEDSLFQVELGPRAGRCSCCGSSAGSCCGSPSGSSQHRCSSSRHDSPDSSLTTIHRERF